MEMFLTRYGMNFTQHKKDIFLSLQYMSTKRLTCEHSYHVLHIINFVVIFIIFLIKSVLVSVGKRTKERQLKVPLKKLFLKSFSLQLSITANVAMHCTLRQSTLGITGIYFSY